MGPNHFIKEGTHGDKLVNAVYMFYELNDFCIQKLVYLLLMCLLFSVAYQIRPLNVEGSLNLLGSEQPRLIYFSNNAAGTLINLCAVWIHYSASSFMLSDISLAINTESLTLQVHSRLIWST